MKTRLLEQLEQQKANKLWRELQATTASVGFDFARNDYLSLAKHPRVIAAMVKATEKYGTSAAAAQTIGGYNHEHAKLCAQLTQITNTEAACLFSSGFLANLALLSTVANKDSTLILDRNCHASLVHGARHSRAKIKRYQSCDLTSLKTKLIDHSIVVTDTVFSMSGQIAPLAEISKLCKGYTDCHLIIDDAHGFGILGQSGLGAYEAFALNTQDTLACTITFGKALGTSGAAIVGQKYIIEAIQQFAASFLFTTALAPNIAAATRQALTIIIQNQAPLTKLQENINYFATYAKELCLPYKKTITPIQFIYTENSNKCLALNQYLADRGIKTQAIRPPTVAKSEVGIRVVLNSDHNHSDIKLLLESIHEFFNS